MLRKFSITTRIYAIVALGALISIAIAITGSFWQFEALKAERIAELTRKVDLAVGIYQRHTRIAREQGMDDAAAMQAAFAELRALRYGDDDYFWGATGMVMRFHGAKPALEGKDLSNLQDPHGTYIFREFDVQLKASGEAVVAYGWPRLGSDEPVDKLSYGRLVPGTDVWIGTGVYIPELNALFWASLRQGMSIAAIGSLLIGALSLAIVSSILGPLGHVLSRMAGLTKGDTSSAVPQIDQPDQVGDIARAVEGFRRQSEEIARLSDLNRANEERAQAESQAVLRRLGRAFGEVVAAVADGDFSRRVEGRQGDPVLDRMAADLNRLVQSVQGGVDDTVLTMARIADGDLTARMNGRYSGAFASLQDSVNATAEQLSLLVNRVQGIAGAITSGTAQIHDVAQDLSRRSENQAASLEETSSTLEEISGNVGATAENSRHAQRLTNEAAAMAKEGAGVVGEVVTAMSEIQTSSAQISEITAVIDSIAFQTNLLALNAAVEAARAGSAGKGFAVVASEVRALAQRAGDASKDIRSLIEQSSSQVDHGAELVGKAGEVIERNLASILRSAEKIAEISSATQDQSTSLGAINAGVAHLDQNTQQYAVAAERSADGSRALMENAERLSAEIAKFKTIPSQQSAVEAA
ncbi:MAG: methyl-accepting chemotaxis protein [Neomegalonema sp.]|nr:methyl-accepting chemotaxis protein [Neomegalonema sp.]